MADPIAVEFESHRGAVDAIIEAARDGQPVEQLDLGSVYARQRSDGGVDVIDLTGPQHLQTLDALAKRVGMPPARKTGHVQLTEHASFSRYVNQHGEQLATTLYADRQTGRIDAVLNGHLADDDGAGWGDHRATLALTKTDPWKLWIGVSGQLIEQEAFAEFLEDRAADIVEPDAATLIEVATTLQSNGSVAWKSQVRLDNGLVQLAYEETAEATAGRAGNMQIPHRIKLALAPFEGGDLYAVEARFRYRLRDGKLRIGIVLDRVDDVLRKAFGDVVDAVEEATDLVVLHGRPAG